jgi:hypothetical protein
MRPLEALRHLLSADYLYAPAPLAGGQRMAPVLAWAAFWLAVCGAAWLWRRRLALRGRSPWAAHLLALLGLLGGAALAAQTLGQGPFSARIWNLSLAALSLALPVAHWLAGRPWPAWATPVGRALAAALSPDDPPLPWRWRAPWLLLHAAGLLTLILTDGIGAWLPLAAIACLGLATLAGRRLRAEILAPLLLAYGAALVAGLLRGALGVDIALYRAYPYPDPWSLWFDGRTPVAMAAAWMLITALALLWRARPRPGLLLAGASTAALAWWAALYARHLSHGASASDPYCYLQMAADLAATGSPRHFFPLAELAHAAQIPVWPVAPVGYHPPLDGWAATVWPIGWPALLAPLYRIGGEALALWGAPLALLAVVWLTYRLARLTMTHLAPHESLLGGLAAAGVMLTSYEAITRSLVPMGDAAVAALSACTLLALLHARRSDRLGWSAAAGLALALAYHVRHPQLPLALAALPAYLLAPWPGRRRLQHLLLFGAAALVAALPDLIYHARAFGSPWVTESPEWFLLAPRYIGAAGARLWEDGLWRRNEFGYLWPLVLVGVAAQLRSRRARGDAWVLLAGFAGVLLFHLCYAALRLRDLIGLFPWLALWAGWGAAALWRWATRGARPNPRRAGVLLLLLALLLARSGGALRLPLSERVQTFGHVGAEERAGFAQLAALLPEGTVVGASLNAGAITRYTGHDAVRPAAWAPDEFDRFVQQLALAGRPLYLLADGEEMAAWLPAVAERYGLTCQGSLALPLYGRGGQSLEGSATLYLLAFPE